MKNLAVITARSGSKGLINKNILPLAGIPLLAWSIKAAKDSHIFEKIHLSTDSEQYAEIGRQFQADTSFLRTKDLSSSQADSWSVLRFVIKQFEEQGQFFDNIMLLQPTSPLRTAEDIINAMQLFIQKQARAVISVCPLEHSPLWANTLPEDANMREFIKPEIENTPRQELQEYYRLNGAIYLVTRELLMSGENIIKNAYAYIMPIERSVDIDTDIDFKYAELLLQNDKLKIN